MLSEGAGFVNKEAIDEDLLDQKASLQKEEVRLNVEKLNAILKIFAILIFLTVTNTSAQAFSERYGVRKFEAFFGFLIACMAASFGFEFAESKPNVGSLFTGMVVPWCTGCDTTQFLQGVSIVGAVIMPHNLYLHSALVKSRLVDRTRESKVKEANKYYFIESFFALFCSFWINVLVVAVFAQGMYGKTNAQVKHNCDTFDNHMPGFYKDVFENNTDTADVDIFHAGVFLGCTFGVGALYVWAIGILAAGQSSTMTGTYAGQFAMEASFQMVQLPFALIPVLTFVSDKRTYYCLVAMGILRPFGWACLPEPQYQDFDAPWLSSKNDSKTVDAYVNVICRNDDEDNESLEKRAL
ncbi:metal ion transporter, metal ion transporter family [Teladorsagia circumcincta]|uniref:Metal ion transporter, metal ion transporter family n=1 Tax=Teladorsagia circumcincta TaxID=45464 RepID=A0A2G9U166_TELCI|nr:metal ion transporter, metal ion transporter family [Teladorsagia circumcincta]